MQSSLLNRFQGGLLGAWIGACLSQENNQLGETDKQLLPWLKLGMSITQQIIHSRKITVDDWSRIFQKHSDRLNFQAPISSGIIALTTLPLVLLFHDSPNQFKEYLYSANKIWQQSEETLQEVRLWQDAIALIVREKLKTSSLIAQLLERHQLKPTLLWEQLRQLEDFLAKKITLQQGISQLWRSGKYPLHEIAIACYCFSYTPQEFSLCVKRAKKIGGPNEFRTDYQPSLTGALTGILAGVYNGISGIPIFWRVQLENGKIPQAIDRQATDLLAVWSGVDQPSSLQPLQNSAIAAPFIIQPRATVKMISQKEV